MTTWYLVRHAQSQANAEGWFSGHTDVGLSPLGEAQADALVPALEGVAFDRVLTSDLRRAVDTARRALGGRSPSWTATSALRERDMGAWTGRPLGELEALGLREVLYGWDTRPPGGESLRDATRRAVSALASAGVTDAALVVAHGGVLRGLLGLLDGPGFDEAPRRIVNNAELIVRELPADGWARLAERLG